MIGAGILGMLTTSASARRLQATAQLSHIPRPSEFPANPRKACPQSRRNPTEHKAEHKAPPIRLLFLFQPCRYSFNHEHHHKRELPIHRLRATSNVSPA